jgi:16S rRNA (guanine527-N7)-methyltransferase
MDKLQNGAQKLGIHLNQPQLEQFETFYRELVDWNQRINLTAITGYEEVQTKHFLDSLSVLAALRPEDRVHLFRAIDIGTGAGLPGIPLKIVLPHIKLTLLEATTKKTKVLEHLIVILGLKDVEILAARAEDAAREILYREKFDLVLSRAVASLPTLAELALPFCAIGGRFIALKKGDISEEVSLSDKAIALLGGVLHEIKPLELEELLDKRALVVIDKIKPTPPGYPRRSGLPSKRPILG